MTERRRRNLTMFGQCMRGKSSYALAREYGITPMRVLQVVHGILKSRGFQYSGVPGRHDLERARREYAEGGLRRWR